MNRDLQQDQFLCEQLKRNQHDNTLTKAERAKCKRMRMKIVSDMFQERMTQRRARNNVVKTVETPMFIAAPATPAW